MSKTWQMLATFVLVAALATSGHAGPGNGNGGNGKGNKPNKEQKEKGNKGNKPSKEDKQAEKEARKAEREAAKAERDAAKEAAKAEREAAKEARKAEREAAKEARKAAKEARKAAKGTTTALSLGQILITDSRIVDLSGDYVLSSTLVLTDGTSETTSVDLSLVQDERGQLLGTALVVLPDGSTTEILVTGELEADGDDLFLTLSGEVADDNGSASILIDGVWDGAAFQSVVTVMYNDSSVTFDSVVVPATPSTGIIIEPALDAHVIGNKIWGNRTVLLPWGTTEVRSQQMNKKGLKFMMHSGEFGIDLRGTVDELGVVDLSRAHLHLGYGTFFIDPATVSILPAI